MTTPQAGVQLTNDEYGCTIRILDPTCVDALTALLKEQQLDQPIGRPNLDRYLAHRRMNAHDRDRPGKSRGGTLELVKCISVPARTSAVIRGIDLILDHHDAPSEIRSDICDQISKYLNTALNEKLWVKRVKYLLVLPLAQYLKCEQPSEPDLPFSFSGRARRWVRNRLNAFNRKNTHLWYSWFQAKRCSLESSDEFIKETYDSHLSALTSPDPGDPFAINAAFCNPTFEAVLKQVRAGVNEKLDGILDNTIYSTTKSACFEATRALGGQHHELRALCLRSCTDEDLSQVPTSWSWYFVPHTTELHSIREFSRIYGDSFCTAEIRQPEGFDEWCDLWKLIQRMDITRPLGCKIQGVLEPLKVRVISKGEALPYYSQRALQKALHGTMRHMPCFRLIGRPFSPTDLWDLKAVSEPDDHWFSVDYSAATDGLSWAFSGMILRYLLAERPERERDLALRVLGPHNLFYPEWQGSEDQGHFSRGDYEWGGLQTNGQLMGSILSFPILCLANLATYLITMSERQQGWSTQKRLSGVLVNGDDMVYAGPPSLWERHKKVSSDLGLSMSVGKAYHHREYANINSTSVLLRLDVENSTPFQIDYLNTGLFFRTPVQKKVSEDIKQERRAISDTLREAGLAASHHEEEGVVECVNHLLKGCWGRKSVEVLSRYLRQFPQVLRDECLSYVHIGRKITRHFRNLFIPESLGGMGIVPPPGWKFKIKKIDQRIAKNLMAEWPCDLDRQLPLSGYAVEEIDPLGVAPWSKPPSRIGEPPIFEVKLPGKVKRSNMIHGVFPVGPNAHLGLW